MEDAVRRSLTVAFMATFIAACGVITSFNKQPTAIDLPDPALKLHNLLFATIPIQRGTCDNGDTNIVVFHTPKESYRPYTIMRILPSTFNYFYVVYYAERAEGERQILWFVVENKTTKTNEIDGTTFAHRLYNEAPHTWLGQHPGCQFTDISS